MRITFIGGTGFIGHAAAQDAVARGHDVVCIHRGRHRNDVAGARSIIADRSDASALGAALDASAPDVVVDTRSMTRVDALRVRDLLACPVVVLSSQDVYAQFGRLNGLPGPPPQDEVDEDAPLTVPFPFRGIAEHAGGEDYDKKEVEAVFAETDAISLRLPAVYGPRDPKRRFGWAVDAIDGGQRTFACLDGGRWRWSQIDVRDAARAITLAAESSIRGYRAFNVAETPTPTARQWVDDIAAHLGVGIAWTDGEPPESQSMLGLMPNDFVADSRRIRRELGFAEITTPAERIAELVDWLRFTRPAQNR